MTDNPKWHALSRYLCMMRDKIFYIYDALCGWCYGFSPVIEKLYEAYKGEIDFEVLSGGMIMGDRVGPVGKVAPYISSAYKEVENTTGVKFGDAFLNNILAPGTAILSSEKPSIALCVFKTYQPDRSVLFAGTLQRAIYYDGIEPDNINSYGKYAEKHNIDPVDFTVKMKEKTYRDMADCEFQQVAEWGIGGFPTVVYRRGEKYFLVARGYTSFEELNSIVEQVKTGEA
jgi:putative protein-disulfide isomerase